jgi:F0F1-type ATP synthase assembly protein I
MEKEKNKPGVPWWQPSLILFGRLSGWIAGPIIIAVFLGKWLDDKYGTEPWLFLLSVGIAFFLSSFGIVRDAMREMKRIEKEAQKKKEDEKKS